VEISTKYLLCQTLCKNCYRVLLRATVLAVVMWKLILNIFCTNLYLKTLLCAAEGPDVAVVMWISILYIFLPDCT